MICQILLFFLVILNPLSASADSNDFGRLLGTSKDKYLRIDRVLSADSFILEDGRKIRLIGLKAPSAPKPKELKRDEYGMVIAEPEKPTNTIEEEAFAFAKSFLEKKRVRLESDIENKDEDFFTLAYGFFEDNTFINAEVLRQGYAQLKIMPPNTKYADLLREAYQEARKEKRGLQSD